MKIHRRFGRPDSLREGDLRFGFGQNWSRFLEHLDSDRVAAAEASLRSMLEVETLEGVGFLDVGSGSGLFSLAARNLGARVHSFDYDPDSVRCTSALREQFAHGDPDWSVGRGSVLDEDYLQQLGAFEVVYSWGVLHHTGAMWKAMANVDGLVSKGGKLFIAVYNDQGANSNRWRVVKRVYNSGGRLRRSCLIGVVGCYFATRGVLERIARGQVPWLDKATAANRERVRGMSYWYDLVDWVGGYPFEVARPEQVIDFYVARGYALSKLVTVGGAHGCNQYVFLYSGSDGDGPKQ